MPKQFMRYRQYMQLFYKTVHSLSNKLYNLQLIG
uniref:Uncharacterized protein n=1 Tax=Ciona intestinalis TaxID=7719 RepID=H2XVF7_CIOIN